jgi:sporulation protein YlmC with PRC-barrel domain
VLWLLASGVKDILVYSKDMVTLGKVKDVEFDPSEMKVTDFIVEFDKEAAKEVLGKMIVLRHAKGRVPTTSIESIKDALNLKLSWKELKGAFKSL